MRSTTKLARKVLPAAAAAFFLVVTGAARGGDPTTADCLAANESSIALRNQHKLRDARAQLLICSAASCPADVREECVRRVTAVNAAIPTIVFEAKDAAGNDFATVRVTMDGQVLVERLEGTALSVEPGAHTFRFEAAGQTPVEKQFVIQEGEKGRRERILFGSGPSPAALAGSTSSTPLSAGPFGEGSAEPTSASSTKRTVGFVVGGAGVVGVAVGAVLLVSASSLGNHAVSEDLAKQGSGHNDHETALGEQTAAFVVGGLGVAALGVGAYLVLSSGWPGGRTAASSASATRLVPIVGTQNLGVGLQGGF